MRIERAKWLRKKHNKALLKSDKTARLLVPLLLSMMLCSFLFVGATWALFTDSISNNIKATCSGKWTIMLQIVDSDNNEVVVDTQGNISVAMLKPNKLYTISIIPEAGTNSQGFCYITFDSKTYFTNKIFKDVYCFNINTNGANECKSLRLLSKWGNCAQDPNWKLLNINDILEVQDKIEATTIVTTNKDNEKPKQQHKTSKAPTTKQTPNETSTELTTVQEIERCEESTKKALAKPTTSKNKEIFNDSVSTTIAQ